jgi:hypothetical protein
MANKTTKMSATDIAVAVQMETGYSISHIKHVLAGRRTNATIVKAAKAVKKK